MHNYRENPGQIKVCPPADIRQSNNRSLIFLWKTWFKKAYLPTHTFFTFFLRWDQKQTLFYIDMCLKFQSNTLIIKRYLKTCQKSVSEKFDRWTDSQLRTKKKSNPYTKCLPCYAGNTKRLHVVFTSFHKQTSIVNCLKAVYQDIWDK